MLRKPLKYIGDDGANIVSGDDRRDIMEGNGGEDTLAGAGGNDRLFGGDGEDILRGGEDDDILHGGSGRDLIFGGIGNDRILAVSGDDFVDGGGGKKDSVVISAAFADVQITEIGGVRTIATADDIITVRNIELFSFDDGIKTLKDFSQVGASVMTLATDNIAASSGRDIFIGHYTYEAGITIDGTDLINGGAGSDELRIAVSRDGSIAPSLQNVETIEVLGYSASFAIDLVNTVGVKTLELDGSTEVVFTGRNASSIVELQLDNLISGALAVEYLTDAISGDSDIQRVTMNSAAGAISVAGVEIMNVVSVASATQSNRLTIDATDLHTLNVAGDARISIDGLGTNTKVFDASLAIGGVELAFAYAPGILATGGEGDDVFDFAAVVEAGGAAAVVDGGEGDDFVVFAGRLEDATAIRDGEYWTITIDGTMVKFKNVELLECADGTFAVADLDNGTFLGEAVL